MSADVSASQSAAPQRSWLGRHKILTAFALLLVVILALVYIFGWPLMRYALHSQYKAALEEVRKNPKVTERLGEPIETVRPFPAGTPDDDTLGIIFSIQGPKGEADVQTRSRMFDGKWTFQLFDVSFSDGTKVDLRDDVWQHEGENVPKFDPAAKMPDDVKIPDFNPNIELPTLPPTPEM